MDDNSSKPNSSECQNMTPGYMISFAYLILALPGIIVYSFSLFVILKKFKELSSTFYVLASALAVADILPLFLICFYGVPCILICGYAIPFISPYVFGELTHVCWYLQISLVFIIAVNRFICMRSKGFKIYDKIFTLKNTIAYMGVAILFSGSMIIMMNLSTVWSTFVYEGYYFGFDLNLLTPLSFRAIYANAVINDLVIFCAGLLYFVAYASLKIKQRQAVQHMYTQDHTNNHNNNNDVHVARKMAERKLFVQFVVVSSFFGVFQLSFYVLPFFVSGNAKTLITGIMYIAVSSMNGYFHLFLNSLIKDEVKRLLNVQHLFKFF